MRFLTLIVLAGFLFAAESLCCAGRHSTSNYVRNDSAHGNDSSADQAPQGCLEIGEARKHLGKTNCVQGTVVRVEEGHNGTLFLDFCTDYRSCPFTVVVFRADLKSIGDVRRLQGRIISIKGRIEEYDDRAEIVLRRPQQLGESASRLTALPPDYDVEREGHYSAGSFRPSKAKKPRRTAQGPPVSIEDPDGP